MSITTRAPIGARQRALVSEQLERILIDPRFSSSARSSRFLRYVVERRLAGEEDEIKEVVIAFELYERASSYDPKVDSTVRVEASRVRAKLERYYATSGAEDAIRIVIPKGTYVPRFEPSPASVFESGAFDAEWQRACL